MPQRFLRFTVLIAISSLVFGGLVPSLSTVAANSQSDVEFSSTGIGRVALEPDFAIVIFTVRAVSKTAQGAVSENAKNVENVIKQLRGFVRPGDRIETTGFGLAPSYRGFLVSTDVQVRTTQVKDLGRLIDMGVRGGADEVSSVGFGREHTKEAIQEAVRQAIQQARESAGAVAAGLGLRPVRMLSIEPSVEQPQGPMAVKDAARAASSAESQIQPGLLTLTARVSIRFVLAP